MSAAASLFVLAVPLLVAATWCVRSINRVPLTGPDTSPLDHADGIGREDRCHERRPHRMLPTEFGWRCANDCGERWYVDPDDELAAADLALWEIENDWEVEA